MAGELRTEYQVVLTKVGDGAAQASREMTQLQAAAATVNSSVTPVTTNLGNLNAVSKTTSASLKVLQGSVMVIGLQSFPQLALGAALVRDSLHALRSANISTTATLGLTALSIAGLTAIVIAGAEAWLTYKAKAQEAFSEKVLASGVRFRAERLREMVKAIHDEGKLTVDDYEDLMRRLQNSTESSNQAVRDSIIDIRRGTASGKMADLERSIRHSDAALIRDPFAPFTEETRRFETFNINKQYEDRLKLLKELREQGAITEHDLTAMQIDADTIRLQSLNQIKKQLTEVQQLQRAAATGFASGFSQAFVDFASAAKSAKDAFTDFARSFLQQVAQMIVQMLVLRALRSVFGSGIAAAGGGTFMAAGGGMFPRFMAAGGMQGVSEVSSPTFFPRFNVVAGEAGREMLTVLARPRFMEVGGMQAVVGNAGGNRLAITNADELERRGGSVDIRVSMEPGLRAQIVSDSVAGSVVRVTQELQQTSRLREAVKKVNG